MEKKIDFSDKSITSKIVYAVVIAILCITAIVVGIVSAASRSKDNTDVENPPISDGTTDEGGENNTPAPDDTPKEEAKLSFIAPTAGTVVKEHSLELPVFSVTLGEWRVHTGIDISCDEGASVYASEAGVVSGIYSDPMLGYTVEITHKDDIKTRYSNLSSDALELKVGDKVMSLRQRCRRSMPATTPSTTCAEVSVFTTPIPRRSCSREASRQGKTPPPR